MFQKDNAWSVFFNRKSFFLWCRWEQTGNLLELVGSKAMYWSSANTSKEIGELDQLFCMCFYCSCWGSICCHLYILYSYNLFNFHLNNNNNEAFWVISCLYAYTLPLLVSAIMYTQSISSYFILTPRLMKPHFLGLIIPILCDLMKNGKWRCTL